MNKFKQHLLIKQDSTKVCYNEIMKRGFIGTIIFLLFLVAAAGIGYFIYQNYSSTPSENTKKVANSIYKYPNATTWQIEDSKNVCFLDPKGCAQPV
ncbi:MAG: hypothetical protein Q7T50_08735, partial [Candidatus Magasanikbacteria bacterium]|nr:hypothetical protein [Candidatus Magasanikbacteria bacterium]